MNTGTNLELKINNNMDIFETYKNEPYFQIKVVLSNENTLFIKFNIFKDKKDNNSPVMRARYILFDKDGNRLSIKTLNLKEPVEFKQEYLNEEKIELLENLPEYSQEELFVFAQFGDWINTTFKKMIESGDAKIVSMQSVLN